MGEVAAVDEVRALHPPSTPKKKGTLLRFSFLKTYWVLLFRLFTSVKSGRSANCVEYLPGRHRKKNPEAILSLF
jgi:hypothetical protein